MKPINSVILIDDDRIFNYINEKTIHQENFAIKIKAYISADMALKELLEIINTNPDEFPEVIFLDINMPGMDGWQFLEKYKELPIETVKHCKVFMLTSSIDPTDIEKSKTYNSVHDFISKPLTSEKLVGLKEKIKRRNN